MKQLVLLMFIVLLCDDVFAKVSSSKNHVKISKKHTKQVELSIHPAISTDMYVGIVGGAVTPGVEKSVVFTPGTESIVIDIEKYEGNQIGENMIDFFILPAKLKQLTNGAALQDKALQSRYNPNSELKTSGVLRLMQALTTDVSYGFDTLPKKIVLPNPMKILHDLLDCNC